MREKTYHLWARCPKGVIRRRGIGGIFAGALKVWLGTLDAGSVFCLGKAWDLIAIVAELYSGVRSKQRARRGPEFCRGAVGRPVISTSADGRCGNAQALVDRTE